MDVAWFTHAGTVRRHNEDGLLVAGVVSSDAMVKPEFESSFKANILAVADGVGGYKGGARATRVVLECLQVCNGNLSSQNANIGVRDILKAASRKIRDITMEDHLLVNMASVVAGVWLGDGCVYVFNSGDCRVYRVNGQRLERITNDHSVVQQLFDSGEITEDEMRFHPSKGIITSAIGAEGIGSDFKLYDKVIPVKIGDRILLCTDGVWEVLSLEELERIICHGSIEHVAYGLKDVLFSRNCSDNVTFIVADM